eukprot:3007286-Pleurochrysis_carterae.AAC.5
MTVLFAQEEAESASRGYWRIGTGLLARSAELVCVFVCVCVTRSRRRRASNSNENWISSSFDVMLTQERHRG